ncbi:hypothetical protein TNCV_4176641 [Trichonephila clavipes]|nr:hypothetical protein TNCV_4176641 [Trichonephila clavipes]
MAPLEYLGITVLSKDRTITIKNLYHPPNSQHLDTNRMEGLFDDNTIILGDFNAKNTTWGSTITNARSLELSNLVNNKAFLCLNDGTHTFRSNSYGSTDVLNLAFMSPGLFPYSSWGKSKQTRSFFALNSDLIKPLIAQRTELLKVIAQNGGLDNKIELNKLKAEIKKIYAQVKRSNWQNLCEKVDYRASNTKLWKLAKQIDNLGVIGVLNFSRGTDNPLFKVDFPLPKLYYALQNLDTNKSLDISCPTLEFWVGKDCYAYVTCHGKLANYQDSGNRPSLFPFVNPTRMPVLRQAIVLFLLPMQTNGMHGAAEIDSRFTH